MSTIDIEQLRAAGLCDATTTPHLTTKGRTWLRMLEDLETQEVVDGTESSADFVLSTNGLSR